MASAVVKASADQLIIAAPHRESIRVNLEQEQYRVGRSSKNELPFPDDHKLSREHLVFKHTSEGWTVQDLGSRNGTYLNGVRLTRKTGLAHGDRITAGHLVIRYDTCGAFANANQNEITFVEQDLDAAKSAVFVNLASALEKSTDVARPNLENEHLAALVRAGRELAGHRTLNELFELVLDVSLAAVRASRGAVVTGETQADLKSDAVRGEGLRISTAVRDLVMTERRSVLIRDARLDQKFALQSSIVAQEIRSILAVPLQTDERVIGLLYLDSPHIVREFTPEDLNVITVLANMAAIRIEHARLQQEEETRKLLSRDLERAAEIQRHLLPSKNPEINGLDVAGYNAACRTVGGDYYDFFPYPDGRLALVIGDVSGKGLAAALLMSSLHARAHVIFETAERLDQQISRLNRSTAANCPGNCFISFFVAVLDPVSDELVYCNAGHNPPLLLSRNGEVESLDASGIPLGISRNAAYEQKTCRLEQGDVLVLFTDGVTEAMTANMEEFGEHRLLALMRRLGHGEALDMIEELKKELASFMGGAPPSDDVTLVVARHR